MANQPKDLAPELAKQKDLVSGLKVQRDSAHRELIRLRTENRLLRRHQEDIRTWLGEEIDRFAAARDNPDQVLKIADDIHRNAAQKLGDAQRLLG